MFGFLKDKLKGALGKLTKEVEKDAVVEKKEILVEKSVKEEKKTEIIEEKKESKKGFFAKIFGKRETEDIAEEREELRERAEETVESEKEETDIIKEKKIETEARLEEIKTTRQKPETLQKESGKKDNKISITINSPIANVFEFTTDPNNTPLWIDGIVSEKTDDSPIKLGTEYKNVNNKGQWTRYEVVKLEVNSVFQLKQKNSTYSVCYTYEMLSDSITRLMYHEWVDDGVIPEPFSFSTLEKLKKIIEKQIIRPVIKIVEKPAVKITGKPAVKIIEKPVVKPHFQEIEEGREHKIVEKPVEEHKGFFTKITETFTKIQISEEKFEELFWDLEVVLLENNVAVEVIDKIKRDLKKELMNGKVSRKGVEEMVLSTLRQSIIELFDVEKINLIQRIKDKRGKGQPYIMAIIGVNGAGKTTSIAKLAHKFQNEGLSVVFAASDTFRAAAIQQLEEHANRLNIKMIKHDYNSDPAAVAFDAIKYAEAHNVDVVMIDTAGRLHSNTNLMRELEKVIRVCKPDIKVFVGESITGNDCVEQAKEFDKAVGIDAIILAKADVDDKGGAAISVSYILQRPILYLGTGQTYDDLKEFDSKLVLESLEL